MRELPPYMRGVDREDLLCKSTARRIVKNPTVLYGIMLEFTRNLFSEGISGDHYPTWDSDPKKTSIWIDTEYEYEAVVPEFRPAVYVWFPNGMRYTRIESLGKQGISGMNLAEAIYQGGHTVEAVVAWDVVAGTRYEAVDIASNLVYLLEAFSMPLLREFCIDKFRVTGFNPGGIKKEEREKNVCTITAALSYKEGWSVKLESPKLKKVVLNTGQQDLDVLT